MYSLISTRKGLIIYRLQNDSWKIHSIHFNGIPVSLAHYDEVKHLLWAFLDHGHWGMKVHRSADFGKTWEEVYSPTFPEGSEVKAGIPAHLTYIWACESTQRNDDISMWLGTNPGGLFGWHEDSKSWKLNESLWNRPERKDNWFGGGRDDPGIHSIVIDPRDSNHFYIGISCAGVYETFDGGREWHSRNKGLKADFMPDPEAEYGHDPHLVVQCREHPSVLWQQNHCGIFRSTDGGLRWTEISDKSAPAYFGFAIAAHPTNSEVAWVAPGVSDEIRVPVDHAFCISRTEDGGKSWVALRKGLPQENTFDIVYRHSLSNIGESLMFGTTTGNVYFSHNGGEQWQTISNNLPMVYAVNLIQKV